MRSYFQGAHENCASSKIPFLCATRKAVRVDHELRAFCTQPPHPRPLSLKGRGEDGLWGAGRIFADEHLRLFLLPSPLEGIGLYTSRVGSPHLSVEPPDWWGARIGMDENPGEFGAVVLEPWRFGKYGSCGKQHISSP